MRKMKAREAKESERKEEASTRAWGMFNNAFYKACIIEDEAKEHINNNKAVKSLVAQVEDIEKKVGKETAKAAAELKEQEDLLKRLENAAYNARTIGDRAAYERSRARIRETKENIEFIKNRIGHITLSVLSKEQYEEIINNLLDVFETSNKENAKKAVKLLDDLKEVCLNCVADKKQIDEMLYVLTEKMMNTQFKEVIEKIDPQREKSQSVIMSDGITTRQTPLYNLAGLDIGTFKLETIAALKRAAGIK